MEIRIDLTVDDGHSEEDFFNCFLEWYWNAKIGMTVDSLRIDNENRIDAVISGIQKIMEEE